MTTMSAERTVLRPLSAVAEARQAARSFLETLGQPAIEPEHADTVILVVSELVTNALRHGGGAYVLRLAAHPDTVEVSVEDSSPRPPRMRTPDLVDGTGGFGWHMVNDLAHATIVTPTPEGGKIVRALLPRRTGG
ncbi:MULTISPECIES: ATP-binding protein [unclassified Streptomyces]|uniref:ATP-binding protein n=1 Tax=unclassified Streptomyces TaxID=2593676 RepID=UPI000DC7F155|nr:MULTISPECIES: ATP-binding protein [unclassified Streptomyces]AWZ04592.1 ATP-binding protein [Streptomyces sp. ICC4]AWZ17305.1 ATP-binding protein [Streptomyces sp. ICC1]